VSAFVVRRPSWAAGLGIALAGAVLGAAIGAGYPEAGVLALLPFAALAAIAITGPGRWVLVLAGFGAGFLGLPFTDRMAVAGQGIWLSDVFIAAAVAGWALELALAPPNRRPALPRSPLLGIPVMLLGVALLIGAWRGHERYGASLIGMPLRLAGYCAIATAMTSLTPAKALRGITVTVYAGVVFLTLTAMYHIASGTSATAYLNLSTGGIRYLGVGAATFAASGVLLALFHLSAGRRPAGVHLIMLLLASFDVVIAYTRTVYLALGIILIVAFAASGRIRSALVRSVPVVVPLAIVGLLVVIEFSPQVVSTLTERLSTPASQDTSVEWRARAYQTVLSGTTDEPWLGIGFGRVTSFTINSQPNVIHGDPHNGFIYLYAGGGLLAVGAMLLVMLVFVVDVTRRFRATAGGPGRTLIAWCAGTWFMFIIHATSEPVLTEPVMVLVIWTCMLLPAVVSTPAASVPAGAPAELTLGRRSRLAPPVRS
jgi:O-antigen ligase